MEKIKERLKEIIDICFQEENMIYLMDKLEFVNKVYFECKTYDHVWENIHRQQAYRIFMKERSLIDRDILGEQKYQALWDLYESAKETM